MANADGNYALTYNDNGIYATVGASFQTPRGQTVQRPADQYKPFAAIINSASNYVAVADNAAQAARDHQGPNRADDRSNFRTPPPMPRFKSCMACLPA